MAEKIFFVCIELVNGFQPISVRLVSCLRYKMHFLIFYCCSQVEVNVSRDPSRLYKLTAGWEQRKKEGPGASGQGATLHMPHRYVISGIIHSVICTVFGNAVLVNSPEFLAGQNVK